MATITKTFQEVNGSSSSAMSTWTVQVSCSDMQITGSYFDITPTITAKYSAVSGKTRASVTMYAGIYSQTADYGYDGSWAGNTYKTVPRTNGSMRFSTASYFNNSNPSVRTISLPFRSDFVGGSENSSGTLWGDTGSVRVSEWGTLVNITLNVPPTFTVSNWNKDTSVYVAGITNVSVDVSDVTAYYGGNISSAKLTIGTQEATISGNGTISMTLQNAGTFTPAVTVTDSRGQTATQNLEPITVLQYENPTVSFDIFRCGTTGIKDDEGHNGLITATFTYMDAVSSLEAPSVQINGFDISQTIGATITWYTALTQTGAVDTTTEIDDWSDIASGATVYGLLDGNYDVTGNFGEGESYLIGLIANDSRNKTSALITQTLSTAFYTIDFQAGGKEIAFGAPANDDLTAHANGLFKSKMDAYFAGEETLIEKPYFSLDTTASSGVDHDLYSAITALGWQSDVIV